MNNLQPKSFPFYHLKITPLSFSDTLEIIVNRIKSNLRTIHASINANKLMVSENDTDVKNAILNADIVSPDGITILLLGKLLNVKISERVTGIDLMDSLISKAELNGFGVFFLGSRPEVLKKAKETLLQKHPKLKISGMNDGYFDLQKSAEIVEKINDSKPQMLFVGMSSPLKEKFIEANKDKLNCSLIMGVGGSFDVISGKIKRSPKILQNIGFEWFYRVLQEPLRLSLRYMRNFFYLLKLIFNSHKNKYI